MKTQRPGWLFLLWCVLWMALAVALLIYPLMVIQPFRHQGPRELLAALAVMRFRAPAMAICIAGIVVATVWYWKREAGKWRRAFSALGVVVVGAAALLSRVNVYELMFHPAGRPAFSAAAVSKLDGDEKVIAVKVGGAARAYPIRGMSYHHVVNDALGGEPIVATY